MPLYLSLSLDTTFMFIFTSSVADISYTFSCLDTMSFLLSLKHTHIYNFSFSFWQGMKSLGYTIVTILTILQSVKGSVTGWTNAHATFYGGSDASGTMGKNGT